MNIFMVTDGKRKYCPKNVQNEKIFFTMGYFLFFHFGHFLKNTYAINK